MTERAEARTGWKLVKDSTFAERSWKEDESHENGNYHCICCDCGRTFQGHKRRPLCKVCTDNPPLAVAATSGRARPYEESSAALASTPAVIEPSASSAEARKPLHYAELLERIDAAMKRITSGHAPMRIPADQTDPDVVLVDCAEALKFFEQLLLDADERNTRLNHINADINQEMESLRSANAAIPAALVKAYREAMEIIAEPDIREYTEDTPEDLRVVLTVVDVLDDESSSQIERWEIARASSPDRNTNANG